VFIRFIGFELHKLQKMSGVLVLALLVNSDGLPFYWEVLPGGTADATTITWLLQRLESRFKIKQITLVFDRGMVS
jgi:transposase